MNQIEPNKGFGFEATMSYLLDQKVPTETIVRCMGFLSRNKENNQFILVSSNLGWQETAKIITAFYLYSLDESEELLMVLTNPILTAEIKDKVSIEHKDLAMTYVQGALLGLFETINKLDELDCHDSSLEVGFLPVLEKLMFCKGIKVRPSDYHYPFAESSWQEAERMRSVDWCAFASSLSLAIKAYVGKSSSDESAKEYCKERFKRINQFLRHVHERLEYLSQYEGLAPISKIILTQVCEGLKDKLTTEQFLQTVIPTLPQLPDYSPYVFLGPLEEFWAITTDKKLYRISKESIIERTPGHSWGKLPVGKATVFKQLSLNEKKKLIGITLRGGIFLYRPGQGKYGSPDYCGQKRRQKGTVAIVGLFVKEVDARAVCDLFEVVDCFYEWDARWCDLTGQVLKLIGDDHPDFIIDNDLLEQIGLDPTINPARRSKKEKIK